MATLVSRLLLLLLLRTCAMFSTAEVLGPATIVTTPENEAAVTKAVALYMQALATREHDQAVALYQRSIESYPRFAGAYNNLAMVLSDSMGDLAGAMRWLEIGARVALETNDTMNYASIETNMGQLTRRDHMLDITANVQAITYYDRALAAEPMFILALMTKAATLLDIHKLDEAEQLFRQAIAVEPFNDVAHFELGTMYFKRGDMAQALHHLDIVIQRSQSSRRVSAAMDNKAHCLTEAGQHVEALKAFEQALEFNPNSAAALANLVTARRTLCNWDSVEELHDQLVRKQEMDIDAGVRTLSLAPYDSTLLNLPDPFRKTLAQYVSKQFEQLRTVQVSLRTLEATVSLGYQRVTPLRIGYLSYDFRNHVMAQLTLGLLQHHDPHAVETYCYSYGVNDGSALRRQVEFSCDVFRDISNCSDIDAAEQIGVDQMDILVDLMGHTKGVRVGITALRPSRLVVNYLGYPGTMGSTFTDFALVDRMIMPPEVAAASMTEHIVYLPHSYQANLYDSAKAARIMKSVAQSVRSLNSLPENAIVFCNFNTINKMEPRSFATWMSILRRVPNSVMWLLETSSNHDNTVRSVLRSEAQAHGIHPARIVFAERVNQTKHIARLELADIYLDSFIYNAHSTASDALWANLPIVTFWGDTFPSRVAAALISNAVEHSEIVVHSLKDYENVAVQLAESIHLRRRIQEDLATNALFSPLFDSVRTANNIEIAYQVMHDVKIRVDRATKHPNYQLMINPEASREFNVH